MVTEAIPAFYKTVLFQPEVMLRTLNLLHEQGRITAMPTLWQLTMGMLDQWRSTAEEAETVGVEEREPVRDTWRAKLLEKQIFRFFGLMAEGAINPVDRTGLGITPDRKITHLLGAHHRDDGFVYDLEILACYPGKLEELKEKTLHVLTQDDERSRWLKDLTVYEGYHHKLLKAVERAMEGNFGLTEEGEVNPEATVEQFIQRCLKFDAKPPSWLAGLLGL